MIYFTASSSYYIILATFDSLSANDVLDWEKSKIMLFGKRVKIFSGLREAVRFLKTKVMRHLGADPDEPNLQHAKCESQHMYNSDEYWECYIRASAVTVYHAVGTCKMGSFDNPNAVVDETLR